MVSWAIFPYLDFMLAWKGEKANIKHSVVVYNIVEMTEYFEERIFRGKKIKLIC